MSPSSASPSPTSLVPGSLLPTSLLIARIQQQLASIGLSERAAARVAGLKPDAIRNIRRGRAPRAETLIALARVLGCSAAELLDPDIPTAVPPKAPPEPDPPPRVAPPALIMGGHGRAGALPLRSRAVGLGFSVVLVAAGEAEALAPPTLDLLTAPEAFAASVPAGAPVPLRRGDLVICDPQAPCATGDLVLAEQKDGQYLVGILLSAEATGCTLLLGSGERALVAEELRRLYRVAEIRLR